MRIVAATATLQFPEMGEGPQLSPVPKVEEGPLVGMSVFIGGPIRVGGIVNRPVLIPSIAYMPIGVVAYPVESAKFLVILPFFRLDLIVEIIDKHFHLMFPGVDETRELRMAFAAGQPESVLGIFASIAAERTERWADILHYFGWQSEGDKGILDQLRECKEQEGCQEMQWFKERLIAAGIYMEEHALQSSIPFGDGTGGLRSGDGPHPVAA